ncbi:MAG: hypothetical protein JSV00_06730, partial [bacterium]
VTTGAYGAFTAPWSPFDEIFPAARSVSTPYVYAYFYDDLGASLGYLYGNPVGDTPAPLTNLLR